MEGMSQGLVLLRCALFRAAWAVATLLLKLLLAPDGPGQHQQPAARIYPCHHHGFVLRSMRIHKLTPVQSDQGTSA